MNKLTGAAFSTALSALLLPGCASTGTLPDWVVTPPGGSVSACAPAEPNGTELASLRAKAAYSTRVIVQQQHQTLRQTRHTPETDIQLWQQQQLSQKNSYGVVPAVSTQALWQGRYQQQQLSCVLLRPIAADSEPASL